MKNNIELIRQFLDMAVENQKEQTSTMTLKTLEYINTLVSKELKKKDGILKDAVTLQNAWLGKCKDVLEIVCSTTDPMFGIYKDAQKLLMNIHANKTGDLEILDPTEKKESENSGGNV